MAENATGQGLPLPRNASELLDLYFLEIRCNLLEAAAGLDRIDRAEGADAVKADPRYRNLTESLAILAEGGTHRARNFLMKFSDPE